MFGLGISTSIKYSAIILVCLTLAGGAYYISNLISENARMKNAVVQLEQAVADKEILIRLQNADAALKDKVLIENQKRIEELNSELETLQEDLGEDVDSQAADSLKEYIRRLKR